MPQRPFRFLHASDLHLDEPMAGLAHIPDDWRERLVSAGRRAAERLFRAAVQEGVEFIVLAGDVFHADLAGPAGIHFLIQQFETLAAQGISVYWAGGNSENLAEWPQAISLPDRVHRFPLDRVDEYVHRRDQVALARVAGCGFDAQRGNRLAEFHGDPTGLFTCAVAYGEMPGALAGRGVHYWAMGGRHERGTPLSGPSTMHYPGTPQGRGPHEPGTRGATLVQVDEAGQARASLIPCDVLRWAHERVVVEPETTRAELEQLLRVRVQGLLEGSPGVDVLASWTLAGEGPLVSQARRGKLADELLDWLRVDYGGALPGVWSVSLEPACEPIFPAAWYEQESVRGDYLRQIRQLEKNPEQPLPLDDAVPEAAKLGPLAGVRSPEADERLRVLREAAILGTELLGGVSST